jgi:glycosyltransferase involved in cell wall biosynthesis
MSKPTIICITPVRNERWIIDKFLKAASIWADHIILADQNSDDGTREVAARYPKVRLIGNPSAVFNEPERRELLMAEARRIPGPRLIFGLDADELLSADFLESPEWNTMLAVRPGTTIWMQWVNLYDACRSCYVFYPEPEGAFAYMDDGRAIDSTYIHSPRIPHNRDQPSLYISKGKVLHYQYLYWPRLKSKARWYQCIERARYPRKSAIEIYRIYHHMDVARGPKIGQGCDEVSPLWFLGYEQRGIDATSFEADHHPYFERETIRLMQENGVQQFKKDAIWDVNWVKIATFHDIENPQRFADPRNGFDRFVHRWLRRSQASQMTIRNRLIARILRTLGW